DDNLYDGQTYEIVCYLRNNGEYYKNTYGQPNWVKTSTNLILGSYWLYSQPTILRLFTKHSSPTGLNHYMWYWEAYGGSASVNMDARAGFGVGGAGAAFSVTFSILDWLEGPPPQQFPYYPQEDEYTHGQEFRWYRVWAPAEGNYLWSRHEFKVDEYYGEQNPLYVYLGYKLIDVPIFWSSEYYNPLTVLHPVEAQFAIQVINN
ncbi:MAG: hypothetical protein ACTSW4_00670, partial [Candidatus Ranarchaeia archaeon]